MVTTERPRSPGAKRRTTELPGKAWTLISGTPIASSFPGVSIETPHGGEASGPELTSLAYAGLMAFQATLGRNCRTAL